MEVRGLKNHFIFSKALAAKNMWRLIQQIGLWVQVVRENYIAPDTMEN